MWRRNVVAVVSALMLLTASPAALAGHSWGDYHWDGTGTPVTLSLEDNLSGDHWAGVLGNVKNDWHKSTVLSLDSASANTSDNCADPLGDGAPDEGLIEVCNDSYGENGWLGVARIWLAADGSHIVAAIAAVNDSYLGPGGDYNNANARRHVLCQELGHTFGLDHQRGPRNQTCMNDMWGLTSSNFVSPNPHDYEQLESIYAHLGGTSGGDDGGGSGGPPCDKKPDHPKCSGANPPGHTFAVERLANGRLVVTWITWAPGFGPDH